MRTSFFFVVCAEKYAHVSQCLPFVRSFVNACAFSRASRRENKHAHTKRRGLLSIQTHLTVARSHLLGSARAAAGILFPDVADSPVRPPRAPMPPNEPLLVFPTTLQHVCSIFFYFYFFSWATD